MLICWPARNEVWGTQGQKRRFIHTSVEWTFSVMVCARLRPHRYWASLLGGAHTAGRPMSLCLIKKIPASFQAPSKLPITYRASPLWVQSKVEKAPLPCSDEWSHIQIVLTLPESSPSQTCFWTPHCASLLWTHWVISGAPGWLSHFFLQISHRLSDICTHTQAAQLSSPHIWLYKQSGQSCPLMFINWVCSLDLSVTPLWVKTVPQAAEEHRAVMKPSRQTVWSCSLHQHCSQERLIFWCVILNKHRTTKSAQILPALPLSHRGFLLLRNNNLNKSCLKS